MKNIRSFEDLDCWKSCKEASLGFKQIIKTLPKEEKALVSNIRRAARSTTRNIAEGYGRFHFKENIQFCRISRGSLYELVDDLITLKDENYISTEEYSKLRGQVQTSIKILNGYINYLRSKIN